MAPRYGVVALGILINKARIVTLPVVNEVVTPCGRTVVVAVDLDSKVVLSPTL